MATPATATFRVATLNTWKGDGDYDRRLPAMIRALAALDADVVLLQEVFRGGGADTASSLAGALSLHVTHQPARQKPRQFRGRTVGSSSGLAILSKTRLGPMEVIDLPTDPRDGERIAIAADLPLPAGRVRLVDLHLTHLEGVEPLRERQVEAVLAALPPEIPVVLGGDFNATPDSGAVRMLERRLGQRATGTAGRVPATLPGGRVVDHLYVVAAGHEPPAVEAVTVFADGADPATGVAPSDHFGVAAIVTVQFPALAVTA